jgi:hypothetical protein
LVALEEGVLNRIEKKRVERNVGMRACNQKITHLLSASLSLST